MVFKEANYVCDIPRTTLDVDHCFEFNVYSQGNILIHIICFLYMNDPYIMGGWHVHMMNIELSPRSKTHNTWFIFLKFLISDTHSTIIAKFIKPIFGFSNIETNWQLFYISLYSQSHSSSCPFSSHPMNVDPYQSLVLATTRQLSSMTLFTKYNIHNR